MHAVLRSHVLGFLAHEQGFWFWVIIIAAGLAIGVVWAVVSEFWEGLTQDSLSDEEREQKRRHREEERHARRMAWIEEHRQRQLIEAQIEAQRKAQKSNLLNGLVGTAAKVGISAGLHALTGGAIKHHHRHH